MQTPAYQVIYEAASRIICVSDYITKSIKSINSHDTKCVTVYNGIDLTAFSKNHVNISREEIGLDDHDFVIVYSGRINPDKGIKELTKAINKLTDYPQIKLMALGSTFYGGNTYDDHPYALPSYLKLADLAVVPSMWEEAFGLTVLEAMATGLPLITTRSGGIPEICEDIAYIVERNNIVENLTEAIVSLYNHPETRTRMSDSSVNRAQQFSKEKYAENFFKALDALPDAIQQS